MRAQKQDHCCKPMVKIKSARLQIEDGFTLAELLVSMGIALILLVGIGGMINAGAKSSTAAYNLVKMETASNEVMNTITRQIRVASHVDPESDADHFTFSGDLSGDGVVQAQSFYMENGALVKDEQPWVESVSAVTFTYYHYDRADKQEEILVPGSFPGWNEQIHRVGIKIEMSRPTAEVDLNRTYRGGVTIMNALR